VIERILWNNIQQLKIKYKEHTEAEYVLIQQQSQIDLYNKYSKSYDYGFYIIKK
jgi:hypothetical protein